MPRESNGSSGDLKEEARTGLRHRHETREPCLALLDLFVTDYRTINSTGKLFPTLKFFFLLSVHFLSCQKTYKFKYTLKGKTVS